MNGSAKSLLGCEHRSVVGHKCHEIVNGCDELGQPFCGPLCAIRARAYAGRPLESIRMQIEPSEVPPRWIEVIAIACMDPELSGTHLVHCVVDQERLHRIEQYVTRVATRYPPKNPGADQDLTPREQQILERLASDESLHEIAHQFSLSYTTVRNHVQHILRKLGVHSIHEAVAVFLLRNE
jgi:DNA-binding CsgD family transcriptional regulator